MSTVDTAAPASAAEQFALRRQSPLQRVQNLLHAHPAISPFTVLVVAFVIFTAINPRFAQPQTLSLVVQQVAVIAALAIGQTLVILTAGIDLSVGAITILSMLIMANLAADNGMPGLLALLIGIGTGTLAGLLNGVFVTRLRLPPFIVTLGTLSIFTAIALLYSGGGSVQQSRLPDLLNWTGTLIPIGRFRITTGVLVVIVLAAV
jgi:fructose transport system permease protein